MIFELISLNFWINPCAQLPSTVVDIINVLTLDHCHHRNINAAKVDTLLFAKLSFLLHCTNFVIVKILQNFYDKLKFGNGDNMCDLAIYTNYIILLCVMCVMKIPHTKNEIEKRAFLRCHRKVICFFRWTIEMIVFKNMRSSFHCEFVTLEVIEWISMRASFKSPTHAQTSSKFESNISILFQGAKKILL